MHKPAMLYYSSKPLLSPATQDPWMEKAEAFITLLSAHRPDGAV